MSNAHVKISENSVNDTSNDTNFKYDHPVLTDENVTNRNLNNNNINNSISFVSTTSENTRISISVYGNDIKVQNPFKIGKCFSLIYFKGLPIITFGPECIF